MRILSHQTELLAVGLINEIQVSFKKKPKEGSAALIHVCEREKKVYSGLAF